MNKGAIQKQRPSIGNLSQLKNRSSVQTIPSLLLHWTPLPGSITINSYIHRRKHSINVHSLFVNRSSALTILLLQQHYTILPGSITINSYIHRRKHSINVHSLFANRPSVLNIASPLLRCTRWQNSMLSKV